MTPSPRQPCATCPWRLSTPRGGFPGGVLDVEGLRLAASGDPAHFGPAMQCHSTPDGDRAQACVGFALVVGFDSFALRLASRQGRFNPGSVASDEPLHTLESVIAAHGPEEGQGVARVPSVFAFHDDGGPRRRVRNRGPVPGADRERVPAPVDPVHGSAPENLGQLDQLDAALLAAEALLSHLRAVRTALSSPLPSVAHCRTWSASDWRPFLLTVRTRREAAKRLDIDPKTLDKYLLRAGVDAPWRSPC